MGVVGDRLNHWKGAFGILNRIQRFLGIGALTAFLLMTFLFIGGILFLDLRRVQEHDGTHRNGRLRGQYLTGKSALHQPWKIAAVIKMDMGEQNDINIIGCNRQEVSNCGPGIPFPDTSRSQPAFLNPPASTR